MSADVADGRADCDRFSANGRFGLQAQILDHQVGQGRRRTHLGWQTRDVYFNDRLGEQPGLFFVFVLDAIPVAIGADRYDDDGRVYIQLPDDVVVSRWDRGAIRWAG